MESHHIPGCSHEDLHERTQKVLDKWEEILADCRETEICSIRRQIAINIEMEIKFRIFELRAHAHPAHGQTNTATLTLDNIENLEKFKNLESWQLEQKLFENDIFDMSENLTKDEEAKICEAFGQNGSLDNFLSNVLYHLRGSGYSHVTKLHGEPVTLESAKEIIRQTTYRRKRFQKKLSNDDDKNKIDLDAKLQTIRIQAEKATEKLWQIRRSQGNELLLYNYTP